MLIMITDGITEAQDEGQNFYGRPRVLAYFSAQEQRQLSAVAACAGLYADVKSFTHSTAPADDITIMAIRITALP
jgi:serine phosphatase RsbU (regulator of sigma subunit)